MRAVGRHHGWMKAASVPRLGFAMRLVISSACVTVLSGSLFDVIERFTLCAQFQNDAVDAFNPGHHRDVGLLASRVALPFGPE